MRLLGKGGIALVLSLASAAWAAAGPPVVEIDFTAPAPLEGWERAGGEGISLVEGPDGRRVLAVEIPAAEGQGHRNVRTRLPIEELRGARVAVEGWVRADGVAEPPQAYNGVKVMLHSVAPDGPRWTQQNNVFGTFDWRKVQFVATVPPEASEAWLVLGLENTHGQAWFDRVRITVVGRHRTAPAEPPSGPVYRGHDRERLRGVMISPRLTEADLRFLAEEWNVNHVRWQLIWGGFPRSPADTASVAEYRAWLDGALEHLDSLLPVCRELGILVALDVHTPPGGRNDNHECRMFHIAEHQQTFIDIWDELARRYRDEPAIWGYDLVNEPVEGVVAEGLMDWRTLAEHVSRRIREVDPERAIIIEPAPWGSPEALDWFEPLDLPNLVYSVHMYIPHQFTHQGVYDDPTGVHYPGEVDGVYYDRDKLEEALRPAIDYQRDYGVHIYIGEFSAIRWAPGSSAHDYIRDVIAICEKHGWDWAYHAFREWDGWSVEHGPDRDDRRPTEEPTDRELLLRSWFEKNER